MQWLKQLLARRPAPSVPHVVDGFPAPWGPERPSLYGFLAAFTLEPGGGLPQAAQTLPDEALVLSRSSSQLRWAPGALDGALRHHGGAGDDGSAAQNAKVVQALIAATAVNEPEHAVHLKDFYDLVNDDQALRLVDPLMDAVQTSGDLDPQALHVLARWLVRESPDRSPVKVGIALLGMLQPARDTGTLLRFGLHDEFTLYAAVALTNSLPDEVATQSLWTLARGVGGWGRIHLVERLSRLPRPTPELKAWLLREGYKNDVLIEYLAYACATAGGLLEALQTPEIDDALFDGAGEIIRALFNQGPGEDITAYDDGAAAVERYVAHAATREAPPLSAHLVLGDIIDFVTDEDRDWAELESLHWTEPRRARIAEEARRVLDQPFWRELVLPELEASDNSVFWTAASAAERMGMDVWEKRFERQRRNIDDQWYYLMRTEDPARVDRVIALAHDQLDLPALASGPAEDLGLDPALRDHAALGFILQDLGRFPGHGWPLVETGLRSPVVRNRNMAVKTVKAWGRARWHEGVIDALARAQRDECNEGVRQRLAELLAGSAPGEP